MSEKIFDLEKYAACARQVAAEGAVLLKNDNQALPLRRGERLAVFGRSQYNYYKSGTGSGGMVNVRRVTGIREALQECGHFTLNEKVCAAYDAWLEEHPYDSGTGWGTEPWYQEEMPLDDALVADAAAESDAALILLGRTAGEDQDNRAEAGSYLLTEAEEEMLRKVCQAFERTIVLLNVGNLIDMKWMEKYDPAAILYVWQGGQEGGYGVLDVLEGTVNPCGRLSDTVARDIADYPSTVNYGDPDRNLYQEDIYVGYRYFETFHPERVLYPFGFGLSYTEFALENMETVCEPAARDGKVTVSVQVTNTGAVPGKEVVQVYVKKPQGELGQPVRSLCGYAKTAVLRPGESERIQITFDWYDIASYDDAGVTGYKSAYVLEPGDYVFYAGRDVRRAEEAGRVTVAELCVIEQREEALAPVMAFERMHPASLPGTELKEVHWEAAPLRTVEPLTRRKDRLPQEIPYTGERGIRLADVRDGNASMESFLAQLTEEDLCAMQRGEGMNSPKVTPGTGGAFGGVTERLSSFGLPVGCCSDGPSGIRMDCGTEAFAMPNGTCMACTFNDALIREMYEWEGLELRKNRIDVLLGPGMNIHRNPLNGRNFEYFSEDPLLSGKMAAAQLRGMHTYGVTGTIKHLACNNQEYRRNFVDAAVSERALREIYLKGFEIAVKEGGATCVMSSYNPLNGIYTAGNYDLFTTILRGEWGFDGIVMTDWWAKANEEGEPGDARNTPQIARAQNDLYMVVTDAAANSAGDFSQEGLAQGIVTRGEMQRNAANLCRTLLHLPVFDRFLGVESELDRRLQECLSDEEKDLANVQTVDITGETYEIQLAQIAAEKGTTNLFQVFTRERGVYRLSLTCHAQMNSSLAQASLSVFQEKNLVGMVSLTGEDTCEKTFDFMLAPAFMGNFYLKLYFGQSGIVIDRCKISLAESKEEEIQAILAGAMG